MQVHGAAQWRTLVQAALAVWLGLVVPLLCVPGFSSTHTHGIHWVWEQAGTEKEAETSHSHAHHHSGGDSHAHSHSMDPAPVSRVVSVSAGTPALKSNRVPQVEQLMNVFGMMGTVPVGLPLTVAAGVVLWVGSAWLFRAIPPLATPWHPPKAVS